MGGANVEDVLGHEAGRGWCPHLAMLLESRVCAGLVRVTGEGVSLERTERP